jgi:large subunit ribosomal protein L25
MATVQHHVALARSLPPRLLRFFARYPPQSIIPAATTTLNSADSTSTIPNDSEAKLSPFKPHKSAITGKWHDPKFSLRRQAELVKLARQHGVEELLPHSVKGTAEKLKRREQNGLRVKGTGVGQKVKGKEWERTLKGRYVHARPQFLWILRLSYHYCNRSLTFHSVDWRSGDKLCLICLK